MRDPQTIQNNLLGLFAPDVDWRDLNHLRACEYAFKNLSMHFIETAYAQVANLIRFDDMKLQMMVRRFHRDAYGTYRFFESVKRICSNEAESEAILDETELLSIRINSEKPRLTRVVAAFSLWMATFRPIFLVGLPSNPMPDLCWLEADTNFYIATSFLSLFGSIEIGTEGDDRRIRLERIAYDFTFRDINLSSLEMLYCSIFCPHTVDKK